MRKTEQRRNRAGGSLVEFALVLPLLFILIANIVNFAGFFNAFIEVTNAGRSASDYAIMGHLANSGTDASGASGAELQSPAVDYAGTAGVQLVANMLATDMLPLPNATSINVRLCSLNGGVTTCNTCSNSTGAMVCASGSGPFSTNPSADTSTGEGSNYILTWVDVNYTYNPIIASGFSFPALGLAVTLPSNLVLHSQSVYRVLQ